MDLTFEKIFFWNQDLIVFLPDLFLFIGIFMVLLVGLMAKKNNLFRFVTFFTLSFVLYFAFWSAWNSSVFLSILGSYSVLRDYFMVDSFGFFFRILAILLTIFYFTLTGDYLKKKGIFTLEYDLLILLSLLSTLALSFAQDFLIIYLAIELQSLGLYILAARERFSASSAESGLQYFILGSFSSTILLLGIGLIYGFTGVTNFFELNALLYSQKLSWGAMAGLFFFFASLLFKLGVAPFHVWVPGVYEGSPTSSTAFFATVAKVGMFAVFFHFCATVFSGFFFVWQDFLVIAGLLSVVVGSFGALYQTNIKRLLAYSGIGHMGFIVLGISSGTMYGQTASVLYFLIYLFLSLLIFGIVLNIWFRENGLFFQHPKNLVDLKGLAEANPVLMVSLALAIFSLAGIPPLAGFFSKLYVLIALVDAGLIGPAVITILVSVLSAFYYIRLVRLLYFDNLLPFKSFEIFDSRIVSLVLAGFSVFNTCFVFFSFPIFFWV